MSKQLIIHEGNKYKLPFWGESVGSPLYLRVARCYGSLNNSRAMQGLAAMGRGGPGCHCKPFSPVTLVFLPAVWTTKALYVLGLLWVKIWASAWYGRWDTPALVRSGEKHGRHRKGGWRVTFIRLWFIPTLHSKPGQHSRALTYNYLKIQPLLSSLSFLVYTLHYVLLFGLNKTFSSPPGILGIPNSSQVCCEGSYRPLSKSTIFFIVLHAMFHCLRVKVWNHKDLLNHLFVMCIFVSYICHIYVIYMFCRFSLKVSCDFVDCILYIIKLIIKRQITQSSLEKRESKWIRSIWKDA